MRLSPARSCGSHASRHAISEFKQPWNGGHSPLKVQTLTGLKTRYSCAYRRLAGDIADQSVRIQYERRELEHSAVVLDTACPPNCDVVGRRHAWAGFHCLVVALFPASSSDPTRVRAMMAHALRSTSRFRRSQNVGLGEFERV